MREDINNYDVFANYPYSEYLEFCLTNGETPDAEESNDYYNFCYDSQEWEERCFFADLEDQDINYKDCIITGYVGRWNGNKEIYPTLEKELKKAILKCIGQNEFYKVEHNKECIHIQTTDHDGTSNFYIYVLSDSGRSNFDQYEEGEAEEFNTEDKNNFVEIPEYLN